MYTKNELQELFKEIYKENNYKPINLEMVSEKLNCCVETTRKFIKEANAYEDCPDYFRNIKKTLHNFDNINEESAYWLGYLMADGCFTSAKHRTNRLMLECKTEDKEILEKFCDFLEIRRDRITSGHKGASVALSTADNNFSTSVSEYGIIYNKSHLDHHLLPILKSNENLFFQYLRGLIDGDGTIHTYKGMYGISLVDNSKIFLEEIKQELEKYLPYPSSIWILERTIEQQKDRNATQSLFNLKIGTGFNDHENLNYIYHKFYDNQKIILTRKEQKLKSIL